MLSSEVRSTRVALAARWAVWVSYHGSLRQQDLSTWFDMANYSSKKLLNLFIFARIQNKELSSAAVYLPAALLADRATPNHFGLKMKLLQLHK